MCWQECGKRRALLLSGRSIYLFVSLGKNLAVLAKMGARQQFQFLSVAE